MAERAASDEKSGVFSSNRQLRPSLAAFSPGICAAAHKPFDTRHPDRIPLSGFCLVPSPAVIPFGDLRQPLARIFPKRSQFYATLAIGYLQ